MIPHKPHSAVFYTKTVATSAGRLVNSVTRAVDGSAVACHCRRLTPEEQQRVFGTYIGRAAKLLTDLEAHDAVTGDWVDVDGGKWVIHSRVDHTQESLTSHTVFYLQER